MAGSLDGVATNSWDLKMRRAHEHLLEVKSRLSTVTNPDRRPIRIEKHHRGRTWHFSAHCDLRRDEMLPVIIGETLFNIRSALDHIAVACVPTSRKSKAQFPIFTEDPWQVDATGALAKRNAERREHWNTYTQGMSEEVLALVKFAQPYTRLERDESPQDQALAILSAFQNADKHRELTIVAHGISEPVLTVSDGRTVTPPVGPNMMIPDGAEFVLFADNVDVEMEGTVKVAMARGPRSTYREIPISLEDILLESQAIIGAMTRTM